MLLLPLPTLAQKTTYLSTCGDQQENNRLAGKKRQNEKNIFDCDTRKMNNRSM